MRAPLPALSSAPNQRLVEDMEVGNILLSIPSLTQLPAGDEKLRIIRADPFGFCRHMIPLTLALAGLSVGEKGPAAKPCATQSATASVTSGAKSNALGAFVLTLGLRAVPCQPMSAPSDRSLQTISNIGWFAQSTLAANCLSLTGHTNDCACNDFLDGNFSQKLASAPIL
jgi:hypothetical protein